MGSEIFPVERVTAANEERSDEQLGTKAKFWYRDDGRSVLFKRGRPNEDWSEKAACECAELLGLPHARIELAECDGAPGIVSPSFLGEGDELIHGNELLLAFDETYPRAQRYHVPQHTLDTVFGSLVRLAVKAESSKTHTLPAAFQAPDLFTGYLLLDAWIGNSDRHHENWAVIRRAGGHFLAPTYDHASSLGRNETLERVKIRLAGRDPQVTVGTYAAKCRSALYASPAEPRPMFTFDAFREAARRRPVAGQYWIERLRATEPARIAELFEHFPAARLPPSFGQFARGLLSFNRDRLLSETP